MKITKSIGTILSLCDGYGKGINNAIGLGNGDEVACDPDRAVVIVRKDDGETFVLNDEDDSVISEYADMTRNACKREVEEEYRRKLSDIERW